MNNDVEQEGSMSTLEASTMALEHPPAISVAVDPVALVVTECITVTSAMRKHARWAHSSVSAILGGSSARPAGGHRRERSGRGIAPAVEEDDAVASRWGLRGKKGKSMQDNPLMSAFARLRNDLKDCKGKSLVSGHMRKLY